MLGSDILEVAIGLAFLYLLLSMVCSTVNELIARALKLRAENLRDGIQELVEDPNFTGIAQAIYQHPLVNSLEKRARPSYIHARTFAAALVDTVGGTASEVDDLRNAIATNASIPEALRTKLALVTASAATVAEAQGAVEVWFDDAMDRVSGWYKRKAQLITLVVGAVVTLVLNVDSIAFANDLIVNPTVRQVFVESASQLAASGPAGSPPPALDVAQIRAQLGPVGFSFGWSLPAEAATIEAWLSRAVGWLITVIAISMGAPFWFDLVNRLANLRATGPRPLRATEERG